MTAEERVEGLAAAARCRRPQLLALGARIAADTEVRVLEHPAPRSVMLELDGPVGAFCLGEAVVTTARAVVDGAEGFACVMGFDGQAALAAALADARADASADTLAADATRQERDARAAEDHDVAATRVTLG